jgi:hypothetical protein
MSAAMEQMALSLLRKMGVDPQQLVVKYGTVIDEFRGFDERSSADSIVLRRIDRNLIVLMHALKLTPEEDQCPIMNKTPLLSNSGN